MIVICSETCYNKIMDWLTIEVSAICPEGIWDIEVQHFLDWVFEELPGLKPDTILYGENDKMIEIITFINTYIYAKEALCAIEKRQNSSQG